VSVAPPVAKYSQVWLLATNHPDPDPDVRLTFSVCVFHPQALKEKAGSRSPPLRQHVRLTFCLRVPSTGTEREGRVEVSPASTAARRVG
jgi:hypothetical protein